MSRLTRTYAALEECEDHVLASGVVGSQVEVFLSQHLLVVMCAEIQESIYQIVDARFSASSDITLRKFSVAASKKILRSIKTGEISGFLGNFGQEIKKKFTDSLDDRLVLQYNTAIGDRHDVAHSGGVQLTLREFRSIVQLAVTVLDAVETSLKVEEVAVASS